MQVLDEIVIESHEPRTIERYYPTLVGDTQLCTDISFFQRVGDIIVFVHRLDGGSGLQEWRDGLLCFPVSSVLDQLVA
jgi:hypothetical protein